MEDLINMLKATDGFFCRAGATKEEIEKAETDLDVVFTDEYKKYLINFGSVTFNGHELTGIHKDKRLDVVQATQFMRQFYPQLTKDFYLIEDTNYDGLIVCQNTDGSIYIFSPDGSKKRIADSLAEYIKGVSKE